MPSLSRESTSTERSRKIHPPGVESQDAQVKPLLLPHPWPLAAATSQLRAPHGVLDRPPAITLTAEITRFTSVEPHEGHVAPSPAAYADMESFTSYGAAQWRQRYS